MRYFCRGFSSPKVSRRIRKDNPLQVPTVPLPLSFFLLRVFYFTALSVNCRRIGSSTGSPACCAPSGDELLLSRASRSRGFMLCSLSSRGSGLPLCSLSFRVSRKAQIAKNNIAMDGEGENNRIGGDAGSCNGDGGDGCGGGSCVCGVWTGLA